MKKILLLTAQIGILALGLHSALPTRLSYLPQVEKKPDSVTVSVTLPTRGTEAAYYLYYKAVGMTGFQVRKMSRDDLGNIYYHLATDTLAARNLEYYIMERRGKVTAVTPTFTILNASQGEVPDIYFQETMTPEASEPPKRDALVKISGNAQGDLRIYESEKSGSKAFTSNGNLRIFRNIVKNDSQFDFDSGFTYTSQKSPGESAINLSNMMIRLKKGTQQIEVGDVSINQSEYSAPSLSRRGMKFEIDGPKFYFSSFFTNSQQKTGFDGYGVPNFNASIFGTVAGANIGSNFKLRGIFMTGRDDLDSKTIYSVEDPYRSGNLFSVWTEFSLLKNRISMNGEYASSQFGSAADRSGIVKKRDDAYRGSFAYNYGIISAQAKYHKVGQYFSSIANLFMQNDEQGFDSSATMTIKTFSLSVTYTDQQSFIHSLTMDAQREKKVDSNLGWTIGTHFRLGGSVSLSNKDYDSNTGLQANGTDMDTLIVSGDITYITGMNNLRLALSKDTSKTFRSTFSGNLSASLQPWKFLTLTPLFSYTQEEDLSSHSKNNTYNINLGTSIQFVPEWLSFTGSNSATIQDTESYDTLSLMLGGDLNLNLAKVFKNKIQPTLTARSQYQRSKTNGVYMPANFTLFLQLIIAF